jgi:protocatechuate 3,4-dioxygenase beta subunit
LAEELVLAQQRFKDQDVDGLIALLDTGLGQTKVAVAGYLADLNASQALPGLQRLASSWPGEPNTNPFSAAATRIKLPSQEPNSVPVGQTLAKIRTMRVQVLEKDTGLPLAGTSVRAYLNDHRDYACDTNGTCQVELNGDLKDGLRLLARCPGHVSLQKSFGGDNSKQLPEAFQFALEKAISIGGIIEDANGRPIEGATFAFYINIKPKGTEPYPYLTADPRTDATGRWVFDAMPADIAGLLEEAMFNVSVEHKDYASQGFWVADTETIEALKGQTYHLTLYQGSALVGRVVTSEGKPIPGATVSYRDSEYTTGPDGVFTIPHIDPGMNSVAFEIKAKGYARHERWLEDYHPGMQPLEIVLQPGSPLSGYVLDTNDNPASGAEVSFHTRIGWGQTLHTDSRGWFATEPLATDLVDVSVRKEGFMSAGAWVKPTDEPQRFILHRPLHVTGRVLDSLTGQPVERFRIRPCDVYDGKPQWSQDVVHTDRGTYDYTFTHFAQGGYVIAVEADEYLPAESRVIDVNEQSPVVDLALTPGAALMGTVVDANGLPVVGAVVSAVPEEHAVFLEQGSVTYRYPKTQTDAKGQFQLTRIYLLRHVVAATDAGICGTAIADLERTGRMVLQSWAEVRGRLRGADGPARNWPIEMRCTPDVRAMCGYDMYHTTHTDDQGTFQIKRVIPGKFTLLGKTYEVAPGQVLNLDVTLEP